MNQADAGRLSPCRNCGELVERGVRRCPYCQASLPHAFGVTERVDEDPTSEVPVVPVEVQPARVSVEHVVAWATHIGRTHRVNQDAGGAWMAQRTDGSVASLLIVADGVSAGRTSEEASRLAVEIVRERVVPALAESGARLEVLAGALHHAVIEANAAISARPHNDVQHADATTLAAAVCVDGGGVGVWCGDSRVYMVQGLEVRQLTQDHSWAEAMVSRGAMTAADAARDARARMITRWLGPPHRMNPGIERFVFTLQPGETLLCCTDGLYQYLAPPGGDGHDLAAILESAPDLEQGVQHLIAAALERGGRDDITVAALRLR